MFFRSELLILSAIKLLLLLISIHFFWCCYYWKAFKKCTKKGVGLRLITLYYSISFVFLSLRYHHFTLTIDTRKLRLQLTHSWWKSTTADRKPRYGADRSDLFEVRLAFGTRVQRRPEADAEALLHQLSVHYLPSSRGGEGDSIMKLAGAKPSVRYARSLEGDLSWSEKCLYFLTNADSV